jgi:hypothetical protein
VIHGVPPCRSPARFRSVGRNSDSVLRRPATQIGGIRFAIPPYVLFGLLPKSEMTSAHHLGIVDQIEISRRGFVKTVPIVIYLAVCCR